MIIETVITGIISALAMKGAEKFVEKSAENAFENRSVILNKVKGLLIGEELTTLNLLEKYPENEDLQKELKVTLKPRLEANPETAKELEKLVQPFLEITNKQNTINQSGNDSIAFQDVSGSDIKINKIFHKIMSNELNQGGLYNIGLQGISDSTVSITQILGKSVQYQDMLDPIKHS